MAVLTEWVSNVSTASAVGLVVGALVVVTTKSGGRNSIWSVGFVVPATIEAVGAAVSSPADPPNVLLIIEALVGETVGAVTIVAFRASGVGAGLSTEMTGIYEGGSVTVGSRGVLVIIEDGLGGRVIG